MGREILSLTFKESGNDIKWLTNFCLYQKRDPLALIQLFHLYIVGAPKTETADMESFFFEIIESQLPPYLHPGFQKDFHHRLLEPTCT